ncbi:MAG: LPS export ABC transporter periplasmic protein LptC [Spirochaetaceae bacterium]|jgi:LPS export ABC transporter protein LptC|nr:LPS export ABC transporter periplasmic protein LptC [Spirochaetaceae bacterium]
MRFCLSLLLLPLSVLFCACTFVYGEGQAEAYTYPEITMEDLDYVRMRDGEMVARLKADLGNRYESRHIMELTNYKFEQYDTGSGAIDAIGDGGAASVDVVSNNIQMKEGVTIQVDSEDFTLRAADLDWQDKQKVLSGAETSPVVITRTNGTEVHGTGFHSDIRGRTWVFNSDVNGVYVSDEEEEEGDEDAKAGEDAAEGAEDSGAAPRQPPASPAPQQQLPAP